MFFYVWQGRDLWLCLEPEQLQILEWLGSCSIDLLTFHWEEKEQLQPIVLNWYGLYPILAVSESVLPIENPEGWDRARCTAGCAAQYSRCSCSDIGVTSALPPSITWFVLYGYVVAGIHTNVSLCRSRTQAVPVSGYDTVVRTHARNWNFWNVLEYLVVMSTESERARQIQSCSNETPVVPMSIAWITLLWKSQDRIHKDSQCLCPYRQSRHEVMCTTHHTTIYTDPTYTLCRVHIDSCIYTQYTWPSKHKLRFSRKLFYCTCMPLFYSQ